MTKQEKKDITPEERDYLEWREELRADPEYQAVYEEEAAKGSLWLQLVEARQATGLTQQQMAERLGVSQSQVARIEKQGYDAYTLNTLRRYVQALGEGFALEVHIRLPEQLEQDATRRPIPHIAA
jgi:DNA-binding XRE family transcriptional regulator